MQKKSCVFSEVLIILPAFLCSTSVIGLLHTPDFSELPLAAMMLV